jgi:hypothetical protein
MFAEEDKGVVFFETVLSLKKQKHTCIECIPVPWEQFDLLPGYFKVRFFDKSEEVQNSARKKIRNQYWLQRQNGHSTRS